MKLSSIKDEYQTILPPSLIPIFSYFPDRYFLDSYEDWNYWEKVEDAAKHVSGIVGYEIEPTVEAIDDALENYQQEHEDEDVFYSFHEFTVVED